MIHVESKLRNVFNITMQMLGQEYYMLETEWFPQNGQF